MCRDALPLGLVRWIIAIVLGLGLFAGCGTGSFSNAVSVAVTTPQQVSVFDPQVGDSAEWAEKTMGQAAPGAPYTTEVPALATKFFFDSSPPPSLNLGVYLPSVTEDGWFAINLPAVVPGTRQLDAPFVKWYSATPTSQTPSSQPMEMEITAGPNGWVVNIQLTGST